MQAGATPLVEISHDDRMVVEEYDDANEQPVVHAELIRSAKPGKIKTQASFVTIFTLWNTMVGSGILTLPWAFYHSGLILGSIICLLSCLASLRTCTLTMRVTEPNEEFHDTIKKYWGPKGFYISMICTFLIIESACTAYFIIMAQMSYQMVLALLDWLFGIQLPQKLGVADFSGFSQTWMAIIIFIIFVFACLQRDLSIFIRVTSYGAVSIVMIMLYIIVVGIYSSTNTNFVLKIITSGREYAERA